MLRSLLIYLSKAQWAQRVVTGWPLAWKAASRFIAGEQAEDAIRVVRELNARGINVTLDHLGEHTSTMDEAAQSTDEILAVLDAIDRADIRANVSIKLTQIGMGLDETVCRDNLRRILARAKERKNFIRIDIEDTPYTDTTLATYQAMLDLGYTGDTFGMALQSYLFRSEADMKNLLAGQMRVRLVKGAYNEPPDKAFPKKADVDANYDLLAKMMMDASLAGRSALSEDGRIPPIPAIATHDEKRIEFAESYANKVNLPKGGMEFQMLYGIRRDMQEKLVQNGYPVRVYVPFGRHWYPYFMRRLAERPANIWFFLSNLFRG
ncbi:MAG: Proline dehydrogenase 2 [Anaerolineales bacterium]|nr:Proline dehydrogenase 2 [Anaerolineales bacterium]